MERAGQIKKIFGDALEIPPAEREKFLSQICGGDAALKSEVKSLLGFDERAGDFLQMPTTVVSAAQIAAQVLEFEEDSAIGKRVGAYRIEREIGRGGMGVVYLAVRADGHFQKEAAIKLLRRKTENSAIVSRFQRERQILADLEHPFIARLLDGGTTENGLPFFVMEYVDGLPLNRFCNERNLSIQERLRLFRQICEAVEFAHRHSIIHRDLKPLNILVTKDGEPKLLDFGIAKTFAQETTTSRTVTALRAMTPEYASPEQLRGEPLTKATDIYSLGVILYELITGKRPFRSDGKPPYQTVQAICEDNPLPPSKAIAESHRQSAETNNGSSPKGGEITAEDVLNFHPSSALALSHLKDLDKIILKALRKEPERRYLSVQEFASDISRLLDGLPVSAQPDTIFYRGAKFFRRHRPAVLSAITVAIVLLFIGFYLNLINNRAKVSEIQALKAAENHYQNLPFEREKGGSSNVEARSMYLKAQSLWNQREIDSLEKAAELFRSAIERDPEFALAYSGLSNTYFLLSVWKWMPAKEIFPQAKTASLKAIELAPELAEGHLSLAMVHWLYEYDWQSADREFRVAISLNNNYTRAYHWYGLFLAEMGRFDEAVESEKRAQSLEPLSIPVKADLARVLFYARRYDEAHAQYREITVNPHFGAVSFELLELYEAAGMEDEWSELREKTGGFDNPLMREAFEKGGMTGYWRKQIELQQDSDTSNLYNYFTLAMLYARLNEKDHAFEFLNRAFEARDHRMAQIKIHPALDNLRPDSRFQELLQKMNLDK